MRPPVKVGPLVLDVAVQTAYLVRQAARLTHIVIANTAVSARSVTAYIVPDGASPAADYAFLPTITIPPNDLFSWSGLVPLSQGDTIQVTADAGGVVFRATVQEEY